MRIRTVEYDCGLGWIARDPWTGKEIIDNFRWRSRRVARDVVYEARALHDERARQAPSRTEEK